MHAVTAGPLFGFYATPDSKNSAFTIVGLGQGGLGCDVARQYQIPKALVYNKAQIGSDQCYTAEGDAHPLEA